MKLTVEKTYILELSGDAVRGLKKLTGNTSHYQQREEFELTNDECEAVVAVYHLINEEI